MQLHVGSEGLVVLDDFDGRSRPDNLACGGIGVKGAYAEWAAFFYAVLRLRVEETRTNCCFQRLS